MRRALALAALLAALAVAAAGCGRDGSETDAVAGGLEPAAAGSPAEALGTAGAAASPAGITVVGAGSVSVTPDTADWSFGVQATGETAKAALGSNSQAMDRVVTALRKAGIARDDLQTEQVSVYPRVSNDGRSIVGYDASNTVRATVRDLDAAGRVLDAAVAAGANDVYGPSLSASDTEAQYRAAVEEAFADARRRAEAIAENAGVTLGAPVAVVEVAGDGAFPYAAVLQDEAAEVAIEPGTQDVAASLTVTFAIS